MISILSVNYNALPWMKLLVASVRKFTTVPYEIIIIDNNSQDGSVKWLREQSDVRATMLNHNIKHGPGMNTAFRHARHKLCLVLDIDAHIMRKNWDFDLLGILKDNPNTRLIAAMGGEAKPIHPCFMFIQRDFFLKNNLSFGPGEGYDVGRKLYPDIIGMGHDVYRAPVRYEEDGKKFYDGAYGDHYDINGQPTIYHNWYSSRMWQKIQVDSLTREEHDRRNRIVFDHPHVKQILGG